MTRRLILIVVLSLTVPSQLLAATSAGTHQYLARKQYVFVQPNASAPAPINNVVIGSGGHVDFDLPRWFVISIPDVAAKAIQQHPAVKYLEQVVSGPFVQPTTIATGSRQVGKEGKRVPNSSPPWSSGDYKYDGGGNIAAIGNDTFTYDALSRLSTANVKGTSETYQYDAFGNLTYKNTHNPNYPPDVAVDFRNSTDATTNHLTSYGYDAAGNLTGDSSETNSFDPVNMQREKDVGNLAELYVYDASDERVGVLQCSGPPANCTNATAWWSLRDESGKVLRQFEGTYIGAKDGNGNPINDPAWAWAEDYVYRDSLLLASERPDADGGRRDFHLDHLGTPRLITLSSGQHIGQQFSSHDYYPFGVEIPPSFPDAAVGYPEESMRFTGHERDFNSGTTTENSNYNDYMRARYRVPQWGRFLSVDPRVNVEENVTDPQHWNRYAYAENNPVNGVDPDGKDTYRINRTIGGYTARSPWNPLTHTFIATTTGGVIHTYSWGNTPDQFTQNGWNENKPEDLVAALQALKEGLATKIGDDSLDPYVQSAFDALKMDPISNHWNLGVFLNCKFEARLLVEMAEQLREDQRNKSAPQQPVANSSHDFGLDAFLARLTSPPPDNSDAFGVQLQIIRK